MTDRPETEQIVNEHVMNESPANDAPHCEPSRPGRPAPSSDARRRLDRRARRKKAAALRDASFDWLASGFTHQEIAAARQVSVAVVRRDIAKAIRARQIETREGHAQLQVARLTRGLALVANRVERGDLAAIGPLVKIVAALDRYQGADPRPALPLPAPRKAARGVASIAAPPPALTYAAPPAPAAAGAASREECDAAQRTPDEDDVS